MLIFQVNIFKINIALIDLMKRYPKLQAIQTLYHRTAISSLSEKKTKNQKGLNPKQQKNCAGRPFIYFW